MIFSRLTRILLACVPNLVSCLGCQHYAHQALCVQAYRPRRPMINMGENDRSKEASPQVSNVQQRIPNPTAPRMGVVQGTAYEAISSAKANEQGAPIVPTRTKYVPLTMDSMRDTQHIAFAIALVFGYVSVGVLFYWYVTDWTVIQSLYFVIVTLTSVGYGDLTPSGVGVRLFTAAYIFFGVGILGTALGEVVSSVLDSADTCSIDADEDLDGDCGNELDLLLGGESALNSLVSTMGVVTTCIAVGTLAFTALEPGVELADAFYYAVVTATSEQDWPPYICMTCFLMVNPELFLITWVLLYVVAVCTCVIPAQLWAMATLFQRPSLGSCLFAHIRFLAPSFLPARSVLSQRCLLSGDVSTKRSWCSNNMAMSWTRRS